MSPVTADGFHCERLSPRAPQYIYGDEIWPRPNLAGFPPILAQWDAVLWSSTPSL